jgi:MFS transporter, ACS family, solute carrier family 17 (sodium-dependent inorganic phosphate cotransporter), other
MRNKPFLAILIAHAGWGFGHTICYAWLPNYYYSEYGLAVRDSAFRSALPWILTVVVTNAGSSFADWLVNRGSLTRSESRKLFQLVGTIGPSVCLLYLAAAADHHVPEVPLAGAVALVSGALALGGLTCTGFASNHQDLTARYTGILFGITNSASSLTGTFSTFATGKALDATHSWSLVFEVVALVYVLSGLVYAAWASADNQFDEFDAVTARERASEL